MIVTVDKTRVAHFMLLAIFTHLGGSLLMNRFDWSFLSAYGLSCSCICQLSNGMIKIYESVILVEDGTAKNNEMGKDKVSSNVGSVSSKGGNKKKRIRSKQQ